MNLLNSKAKQFFINHFKTNLNTIEVNSGICRYNFQCHMNAVHDAIVEGDSTIAMCVYICGKFPIIHFVKVDEKTSKYIDNTLGQWSQYNEYRLIRLITKDEFRDIDLIFQNYRQELKRKLPFWIRILSDYTC